MKLEELSNLIEKNTAEDGTLNKESLLTNINGEAGVLADRKLSTAKKTWESDYSTNFIKDLGFEDTSGLKSFIEERKSIDPTDYTNNKSIINKLQNTNEIYKSGFKGSDEDLDYIMFKADKSMSENSDTKISDIIEQLKETRGEFFGSKTTGVKNSKPDADANTDPVYAAFQARRNK